MAKYAAMLLALLLVAAAFFLPVRISQWQDGQLLDEPHVTHQEEREGFAESTQLSVPEKLLLMRSGTLTGMALGGESVQGLYSVVRNSAGETEHSIEHAEFPAPSAPAEAGGKNSDDVFYGTEEAKESQAIWDQRLTDVWSELQALQSMGGLPELWGTDSEMEYVGSREVLYVDSDTGMRFRVYTMSLSRYPYDMDLTVDEQSGRILAFTLSWAKEMQPSWGVRGASRFGIAWRDYWGLDSLSSDWYTDYIREILESSEESLRANGTYNANGQIVFSYDGQSVPISLSNWVYSTRDGAILWN